MKAPHFKLKDSKAEQETSIRLYVFHSNFPHRRFVYGLKESVPPALWDDVTQRPTENKKLVKEYEKHLPTIANKLKKIRTKLDDVNTKTENYFAMAAMPENGITITVESLKNYLDAQFRKKIVPVIQSKKETLNKYIERFIKELESGSRLYDGRAMTEGSIKNYKTFQSIFNIYQNERRVKLNFDNITLDFYHDFIRFLNTKKYRINTIGKHIARIKVIMRKAKDEDLHSNTEFLKSDFKAFQVTTDEVYLTEDELKAIHKADLSEKPHLELYRDIFLIGCYTAQRVSDYNNLKPHNIVKLDAGKKAIKLYQKKTKESVIIPIKKELDIILKKYKYAPTKVAEQNLNDAIKDICEIAGIKQMIEIEESIGGKKVKSVKPKFQLVASHTARRTGATNMYLAGIPTIDCMAFGGWKKESTFLKYIRVTKEETANKHSTHKHFK